MTPLSVLLSGIFLILVLFFSCERQKGLQPQSTPPEGEVAAPELKIEPAEATSETTLYISSKDIDLSKTKLQWYVNGKPIEGAVDTEFTPFEIKKGDSVYVKASVGNQEVISNQITIKNIPPAILSARILPPIPKADDVLKVDVVGSDRDNDRVSYRYEWSKNGRPAGSGEFLKGPFKRGDKISLKITPYDGEDYGQPVILTTDIYNSPPRLLKESMENFEKGVYYYQIKATDPDGDILTYNLKQAPKGMVIDKTTGLITWNVSEKDSGSHTFAVEISDGHGGRVLYNLDVTIRLYP